MPATPSVEQFASPASSSANKHERVLDEAARQLNENGVLLTSLSEIAAKLGVTRGAMYYYVADREDLVFQCYRRAAEITARHLLEAGRAEGTAADVLRVFVTRMHGALSPEGQAAFDRNSAQLGDAYHALIRKGIEEGSIASTDDVEARALMLPGLVSWLVKEDVPRDAAQQRHIAREVANLVALGLRQRD